MAGVATAETFNYKVVRQFAIMTVVWGIVGMLVGVIIAAQLLWPELNFGIPWLSYGRLRPLHTNAVIFAFGGSRAVRDVAITCVQRTCQVRLFCGPLAAFTFWGWTGGDRAAAITLPLGITTRQGVRRARVADRHPDHARVGRRTPSCSSARSPSARRRTSTSPTGSSARSS